MNPVITVWWCHIENCDKSHDSEGDARACQESNPPSQLWQCAHCKSWHYDIDWAAECCEREKV